MVPQCLHYHYLRHLVHATLTAKGSECNHKHVWKSDPAELFLIYIQGVNRTKMTNGKNPSAFSSN